MKTRFICEIGGCKIILQLNKNNTIEFWKADKDAIEFKEREHKTYTLFDHAQAKEYFISEVRKYVKCK